MYYLLSYTSITDRIARQRWFDPEVLLNNIIDETENASALLAS
jgi:hypothetical protein